MTAIAAKFRPCCRAAEEPTIIRKGLQAPNRWFVKMISDFLFTKAAARSAASAWWWLSRLRNALAPAQSLAKQAGRSERFIIVITHQEAADGRTRSVAYLYDDTSLRYVRFKSPRDPLSKTC